MYLAIVASDVQSTTCSIQFMYNLYFRHEPGDPNIVVAVFRQQKLARQLYFGCLQRKVTQEAALFFYQSNSTRQLCESDNSESIMTALLVIAA